MDVIELTTVLVGSVVVIEGTTEMVGILGAGVPVLTVDAVSVGFTVGSGTASVLLSTIVLARAIVGPAEVIGPTVFATEEMLTGAEDILGGAAVMVSIPAIIAGGAKKVEAAPSAVDALRRADVTLLAAADHLENAGLPT